MIVVNHESVSCCNVYRKYCIWEAIHCDTQLHTIAIHEIIGRNIEIVASFIVYASCKEIGAFVVNFVTLLISIFRRSIC